MRFTTASPAGGQGGSAAVSRNPPVPAKIYPTGIIEVQAALNKPGRYAVLLTVNKQDHSGKGQVRIPLQVAPGAWPPLLFTGLGAAAGLYLAYRRFRAVPSQ